MRKSTSFLLITLVVSLIGNVYLYYIKQYENSNFLHSEVSSMKVFTQNTIAGIQNNDISLLKQTYGNFQSNPPFADLKTVDSSTERVINKYEGIYKTALNGTWENNSLLISKLEKSFKILVVLSETEKLNEEKIRTAMAKIDKVLSKEYQ